MEPAHSGAAETSAPKVLLPSLPPLCVFTQQKVRTGSLEPVLCGHPASKGRGLMTYSFPISPASSHYHIGD